MVVILQPVFTTAPLLALERKEAEAVVSRPEIFIDVSEELYVKRCQEIAQLEPPLFIKEDKLKRLKEHAEWKKCAAMIDQDFGEVLSKGYPWKIQDLHDALTIEFSQMTQYPIFLGGGQTKYIRLGRAGMDVDLFCYLDHIEKVSPNDLKEKIASILIDKLEINFKAGLTKVQRAEFTDFLLDAYLDAEIKPITEGKATIGYYVKLGAGLINIDFLNPSFKDSTGTFDGMRIAFNAKELTVCFRVDGAFLKPADCHKIWSQYHEQRFKVENPGSIPHLDERLALAGSQGWLEEGNARLAASESLNRYNDLAIRRRLREYFKAHFSKDELDEMMGAFHWIHVTDGQIRLNSCVAEVLQDRPLWKFLHQHPKDNLAPHCLKVMRGIVLLGWVKEAPGFKAYQFPFDEKLRDEVRIPRAQEKTALGLPAPAEHVVPLSSGSFAQTFQDFFVSYSELARFGFDFKLLLGFEQTYHEVVLELLQAVIHSKGPLHTFKKQHPEKCGDLIAVLTAINPEVEFVMKAVTEIAERNITPDSIKYIVKYRIPIEEPAILPFLRNHPVDEPFYSYVEQGCTQTVADLIRFKRNPDDLSWINSHALDQEVIKEMIKYYEAHADQAPLDQLFLLMDLLPMGAPTMGARLIKESKRKMHALHRLAKHPHYRAEALGIYLAKVDQLSKFSRPKSSDELIAFYQQNKNTLGLSHDQLWKLSCSTGDFTLLDDLQPPFDKELLPEIQSRLMQNMLDALKGDYKESADAYLKNARALNKLPVKSPIKQIDAFDGGEQAIKALIKIDPKKAYDQVLSHQDYAQIRKDYEKIHLELRAKLIHQFIATNKLNFAMQVWNEYTFPTLDLVKRLQIAAMLCKAHPQNDRLPMIQRMHEMMEKPPPKVRISGVDDLIDEHLRLADQSQSEKDKLMALQAASLLQIYMPYDHRHTALILRFSQIKHVPVFALIEAYIAELVQQPDKTPELERIVYVLLIWKKNVAKFGFQHAMQVMGTLISTKDVPSEMLDRFEQSFNPPKPPPKDIYPDVLRCALKPAIQPRRAEPPIPTANRPHKFDKVMLVKAPAERRLASGICYTMLVGVLLAYNPFTGGITQKIATIALIILPTSLFAAPMYVDMAKRNLKAKAAVLFYGSALAARTTYIAFHEKETSAVVGDLITGCVGATLVAQHTILDGGRRTPCDAARQLVHAISKRAYRLASYIFSR